VKRLFVPLFIALFLIPVVASIPVSVSAADDAPGYVMRFADIGHGQIVFTYEDDLWLVSDAGGSARRLTSHEGRETGAKFSPDGKQLAFSANYDGGTDIYVMNAEGGVPRRVTYHPGGSILLDWCPDGEGLIFRANRIAPGYSDELYRIPIDGGMASMLPVDRGALASVAPDKSGLAYNRIGRHTRTWKRYEGGLAQDIWVKDFGSGDITKITDWQGSDQFPMWGQGAIYFASDRANATLNLYRYDTTTKQTAALTDYSNYDVKYPSLGENKIVYQHGPGLSVFDLVSGQASPVPITIPSDRRHLRTELITAEAGGSFGLSPAGERAVVEARGEILNLPADEGDALNLTRDSGSHERNAVWSPDGRWIALVSDRTGEQQVYLVDQRGQKEWKQITKGNYGFIKELVWSPDSKSILFSDKFMKLHLAEADGGSVKVIAHSDYDDAWERWGIMDYVWSPDSRWVAYTSQTGNMNEAVWLYDTNGGKNTQITGDMTQDWSPSFSRDGLYLYFLSNRTFQPIMGRQDQNHVFLKTALPYMILLQDGTRSPFHKDDVAVAVTGDDEEEDGKKEDKDKDDDDATVIDLKGIADRVLVCDGFEPDNYFRLDAVDGGFMVLRKADPEFIKYQHVDDHTGGALDLLGYTLEDAEVKDLMSGVANYHLSADGKKMIYRARGDLGIADAGKPAKVGDGKLDPGAVKLRIDRLEEFPNIFAEAWRIQRDWFYDRNMHGVNWQKMYDKYAPFVAGCGTRGDLNFLIGEMISELNIGHTYIFGGQYEDTGERVRGGLLGCDFTTEKGKDFYKITDIVRGVSWDPRYRSPLNEPGVGIAEGDYLIAIDGVEVKVGDNVYEQLVNKSGAMVSLTTNKKPESKNAATVRVRALRGEYGLRYRAWVDDNLDYVADKTDGDIGYIHVPNMGEAGLVEFGRSWYPQTGKKAMIIDDRFNGGGFVGDMIIDRLERKLWSLTQPREGKPGRNPERTFHGPLVVLINEDTYSNGEFFAEAVKRLGIATLIGVRTWGGSTGIEPHQNMVDGGGTTPPQFGLYGLDGSWPIEGWGVEPDIIVLNLPNDVLKGEDTQLDAAIEYLQKQLKDSNGKWDIPGPPAYPNKAKPHMSGGLLK
jgi:tricorn protease